MAPNGEWDVFGADFGLGLPIAWFDVTAISALLDDTLTGSSVIDQLVIGWDGEEEDAWEIIRKMLRAKGWFMGLSAEGKITFARLRMANVTHMAAPVTVAPIPYSLRMEPPEGEGIDRMTGVIGELPWKAGVRFDVNMVGDNAQAPNSLRAGIFAEQTTLEMDLSVIAANEHVEGAALEYASLVKFRSIGAPRIFIRANDPGTVSHGDMLKIGDPLLGRTWFVDADGAPIEVDSSPRWFGQVIGFRRNLGDGSIDLTMLLHNYFSNRYARLRAPNAIVASVAAAVYTCELRQFLGPDGTTADVDQFTVGDQVEVWTQDGVRRSGTSGAPDVQEITAIDTGALTITLDAAWTTPPVAGDIIRLAHLATTGGSPEADSAKYPGFRAYTWLADDAGTLASSNIDGDIFDFGMI